MELFSRLISCTLCVFFNTVISYAQSNNDELGIPQSIRSKYTYSIRLDNEYIKVWKQERWGLTDNEGNLIIPAVFNEITSLGSYLIKVRVGNYPFNDRYGVYNKKGILELDTIYSLIGNIEKGHAIVQKSNGMQTGLIDEYGKWLLPPEYSEITFNNSNNGIAKKQIHPDKLIVCFVDTLGNKKMDKSFDNIELMDDGGGIIELNNHYGYVDKEMKTTIPIVYDKFGQIVYGLFPVSIKEKWGLIKENGASIVPTKYKKISIVDKNLIFITDFKNKSSLVDLTLKNYTNPRYDANRIRIIKNVKGSKKAYIVSIDGREGVVNREGRELVPCIYDDISEAEYDVHNQFGILVSKEGKYGLLNRDGKEITPLQYDEVSFNFDGHGTCQYALVRKIDKWGCVDTKNGQVILNTVYDNVSFIADNQSSEDTTIIYSIKHFGACLGNKRDTINSEYEFELKQKTGSWQKIYVADSNGILYNMAVGGCQWALVNLEGKFLTAHKYERLRMYFHEGLLPVMSDGKWGFIDSIGNEIIPCKFESDEYGVQPYFDQGKAKVMEKNRSFYINRRGIEIMEEE